MTQEEITGTIIIAEYMGYKPIGFSNGWFSNSKNKSKNLISFKYCESIDALAPVIKKVINDLINIANTQSKVYLEHLNRTISDAFITDNPALLIMNMVVFAINFIKDNNKTF